MQLIEVYQPVTATFLADRNRSNKKQADLYSQLGYKPL